MCSPITPVDTIPHGTHHSNLCLDDKQNSQLISKFGKNLLHMRCTSTLMLTAYRRSSGQHTASAEEAERALRPYTCQCHPLLSWCICPPKRFHQKKNAKEANSMSDGGLLSYPRSSNIPPCTARPPFKNEESHRGPLEALQICNPTCH